MKIDIVFNATPIEPPLSGVGNYALNVLKGFLDHPDVGSVVCFQRTRRVCPIHLIRNTENQLTSQHQLRRWLKPYLAGLPYVRKLENAAKQLRLWMELSALDAGTIYFEPNYIAFTERLPSVTVVHDLSHLHYPEFHPKARLDWLLNRLARTIDASAAVVTVSEASKKDIVGHFNVPEDKIVVAPPGVDDAFSSTPVSNRLAVLKKYGLNPGYLLVVGTLEPRKNLLGLVNAYRLLPQGMTAQHPLVIAGPLGWHYEGLLENLEENSHNIILTGYVDPEDLPGLYSGAHGFAYPSFMEGFGMPLLEAMAAGVPVLTSNCSSMPEVTGSSAILVDPTDPEHIAQGLRILIEDRMFRKEAVVRGRARARDFRWEKTVDTIIKTLAQVRQEGRIARHM